MKRFLFFTTCSILTAVLMLALPSWAQECTTIQDGTLETSDGQTITPGYDFWGYNYQAHMFNGGYCDAYHDAAWCQPYKEVELSMKWNNAWLSNQSCDMDALLDRHYGFLAYQGSGAWLTNHQKGAYIDSNGRKQRWEYFVKIVAAPADAVLLDGIWKDADGIELGPVIWGEFAVIQSVYNDTGTGDHGIEYLSPNNAGLGSVKPKD